MKNRKKKQKIIIKICEGCGSTFETLNFAHYPKRRFCSKKCTYECVGKQIKKEKKLDIKICLTCGNEFSNYNKVFCSAECRDNKPKKEQIINVINKSCEFCKEKFEVKNYSPYNRKRFCSLVCKGNFQKGVSYKNCLYCKKKFFQKYKTQKYCSNDCGNKGRREKILECICLNCNDKFETYIIKDFCTGKCRSDFIKKNKKPNICLECGKSFNHINKNKKYCSEVCLGKCIARNLNTKEVREKTLITRKINKEKRKNAKEEVICKICNEIFLRKKYGYKKQICSKKCESINKSRLGKKPQTEVAKLKMSLKALKRYERPPFLTKICPECGGEFQVKNYYGSRGKKYCSFRCGGLYRQKHNTRKYTFFSESALQFLIKLEEIYRVNIQKGYEEKYIAGKCYDGFIIGTNILLEIDGHYYHSSPKDIENDRIKDEIALKYNYQLYRFRVDDLEEIERRLIEYKDRLDAIFLPLQKSKEKGLYESPSFEK